MLGILLIVCGCGLVGRRKTIKKHLDPGYHFNHHYLPHIKAQMAQRISLELFQLSGGSAAERAAERRNSLMGGEGNGARESGGMGSSAGAGSIGGGGGSFRTGRVRSGTPTEVVVTLTEDADGAYPVPVQEEAVDSLPPVARASDSPRRDHTPTPQSAAADLSSRAV